MREGAGLNQGKREEGRSEMPGREERKHPLSGQQGDHWTLDEDKVIK
jgi:hypothetical protein